MSFVVILFLCTLSVLCQAKDTSLKSEQEIFENWVTAHPNDKEKYEQKGGFVYPYGNKKPMLSSSFFRKSFKNFYLREEYVVICPPGKTACHEGRGSKITFEVWVSGMKLPTGAVTFSPDKKIMVYEGPRQDLSRVLTAKEARRKVGKSECAQEGRRLTSVRPILFYGSEAPFWTFDLGYDNACWYECHVNALTGAAETQYRCGMENNPGL